MTDNDKFGFYTVGKFKTYSKLEAIEHSGKVNLPVEWNFNREKFSQIDWMQEPPGSLEFWYEQRARQLREKYDYLVIWYSGGADSHNVLMSFVKNNIFVDEIAQYHNLSGTNGNKKNWVNNEVFATSAPLSQQLIENNPIYKNTKHRLYDVSDAQLDLLTKADHKWDYFYQSGRYTSPINLALSYTYERILDYQKLINKGKSVCFVYGAEKPFIEKNCDNWYITFEDRFDYAVCPRTQMLNRPWEHNELFYWSDSMPQVAIKQSHVVKNFVKQLTPELIDNVNVSSYNVLHDQYGRRKTVDSWWFNGDINNTRYQLLSGGLHKLIYPYWVPGPVVAGKPISHAYSPKDSWLFESGAPDIGQKYYNYGLLHLREKIKKINPDLWWEFPFDPSSGVPYTGGIKAMSNKYRIG